MPSLWCTVLPSTHHPCSATVLTSPSLTQASTTPCVLSPGVCVRQRLPSYPSSPASHHPTSAVNHTSITLLKQPWRTRITYFTSEFLLLPRFPGSVSGHAGLSLDMLPASSVLSLHCWEMQDSAMCMCGYPTQTVQHVVTDCVQFRSSGDLLSLCSPDEATRTWLHRFPLEL